MTEDGYYSLDNIMREWGHKEGLSYDVVLNAVSHSLFRRLNGEHRVRFCV